MDSPASIMDSPASIMDSPASIMDSPASIMDSPASIMDSPASIMDSPASIMDSPASIIDSPASSSQSREAGPRKVAHNREGAREREMHLYLPYWGFSETEKFAQQSVGNYPNLSHDNVLTVFAQLAALRMNAQRALISLFDRKMQHVVAEATPTLALRGSEGRQPSEALWLGVCRFPRQKIAMCCYAINTFIEDGRDIFVVNDLTADPRFRDHLSVTGSPHNKFYVSVPILSPDNFVIGSVAVLDNKPRNGIAKEQETFLKELSITVMDHLVSQRAMREEYREEKMVRALALFVKGKADLDDWFYSPDIPDLRYGGNINKVNERLEKLRVSAVSGEDDEPGEHAQEKGEQSEDSKSAATSTGVPRAEHISPVQRYGQEKADTDDAPDHPDREDEDAADNQPGKEKHQKQHRPKLSPTTSQLQESLAPSDVRSVVGRAARMIYQALDVEGAMFIDASVYARRQTVGSPGPGSDNPEEYSLQHHQDCDGGENEVPSATHAHPRSGSDASDRADGEARSLVLGHYTSSTSGKGVNIHDSHYVSLSGRFVSHLIEQYPQGKIFHIEEDGSISLSYEGIADDIEYSKSGNRGAQTTDAEHQDIEQETMDIKQLMEVLPDARCISLYPIWDFQRGRWFTVCVVWTNDPGHVLSEPKDLTYLAAFSNTVMAEVSRLDLEATDRAKSDFISSISHELRSPLHGLLGTVELLQEMANTYAQRSLIETVYSCGRTLLDTMNHLLDYAKINTLTRPRPSDKSGPLINDVSKPQPTVPGSMQDEDLSVLVQEVIEGLLAGGKYQRHGADSGGYGDSNGENGAHTRLITIVDIEWQDTWRFSVYAGAWRRVVMNLFGNALKYTQTGYIRLLMRRDTLHVKGKPSVPAICMTFGDSGRGMSKDFLTNHLYSAFLQEDTTSPGLGVGLHLVHQIVKSLGGQIRFSSEVGRGTDVDVILPIAEAEQASLPSSRPQGSLQEQLRGKTISLFTKSARNGDLGFDIQVFNHILLSLGHMISDWFGLRVLTAEELDAVRPDLAIVTEHEYRNYYCTGSNEPKPSSGEIQPTMPLIVLSARTSSWKNLGQSVDDMVIFLTQPVSPKTLGTAFAHCLNQESRSGSVTPTKLPSPRLEANNAISDEDWGQSEISRKDSPGTGNANKEKGARNILLVEDNQVNLKVIEMCVKSGGFSYHTANNGLEALERFKADQYDAVVMDISMPVMDGLTATREMRQFERKSKRPPATIIILTAVLSSSMQQEAMVSGVNLFLTKPTPLKQLKGILRDLSDGKDVSETS